MSETDLVELERFLLDHRNPDGGWGYYPGKSSRLEPTCWALLALADRAGDASVLSRWPAEGGLLRERPSGAPNLAFHAVALLTLHALGVEHGGGASPLVSALQGVKGDALGPWPFNRQDNDLQAWPWIPDTFSWVEPTAWCMLALKKWRAVPGVAIDASRLDTAERLLFDRVCAPGGWNYGNSNMLGLELKPYIATTALGVLAMQDRQDAPEVARSIGYLQASGPTERSGFSLALAMLALHAVGKATHQLLDLLLRQAEASLALESQLAVAASLYALRVVDPRATHDHAFRLR